MPKSLLLITGASGFVGSHAVRFALEGFNYDAVVCTDVQTSDQYGYWTARKLWRYVQADLTKPEDLENLRKVLEEFPEHQITVWHIGGCFNYAAPRELLYRVNVLGTKNLAEMLLKIGAAKIQRLIFWSGGVVYGNFDSLDASLPADENYPVNPQNDYGWSKKEAEDWLLFFNRQFALPVTIMRLAAIYGPNARYGMGVALWLNDQGLLAPMLAGNAKKNHVALIHVEDVVRVADFLSEAKESNGEIYNVVDDIPYTVKQASEFIGERLNNKPFSSFSLPGWVLRTLIKLVQKRAKQLGGKPSIDPELGNMVLLDAWMSNKKLRDLGMRHGHIPGLLKYWDSLRGLADTIERYKKEARP
ncbi:MAG: NAD(P)-dependent oxidoreductase [bacterium]|nr:NAD(P)-dependent oxidoreductase [bacterium]